MAMPDVHGFEVLELHDYGGCGEVYRARDEAGGLVALKLLDDLSVSRPLLTKMCQRLEVDGWPSGVMPLLESKLDRSPLYQVMPWLAAECQDGSWLPRSLQYRLDDFPQTDAWGIIRDLARAIAQMHTRHVPHGNLKPGNIFINTDGRLLLSDWCLGNMPGVHVFHFTDALLYQPPEQLRDTSGYLDEEGYRWDVFAFGVISFRLLTGHFPRCEEVFQKVAPVSGKTRCEGLKADPEKVAHNLESSEIIEWPEPAGSVLEERLRECILNCLDIDPAHRPVTMTEVCAGFELVEREEAKESERQRLLKRNRRIQRRASVLLMALGACVVAIIILAGLWRLAEHRLLSQAAGIRHEREVLQTRAREAGEAQKLAEHFAAEAKRLLERDRSHNLARLQASRLLGDSLFAWAMEKDRRQLPPLDGRESRLQRLEAYYSDFLVEAGKQPVLGEEAARARLQLAEIAIARGDVAEARARFATARKAWASRDLDADMRMRLATDSLLIAKMLEGRSEPDETLGVFAEARESLLKVPRQQVDADRLDQLLAVLDYREAKLRAQQGDEELALEQLMRATETLNRISRQRPEIAILHSALADCYLSSAGILEGLGNPGDAREVRSLAVAKLLELRKSMPDDLKVQFDLASCYGAMADAAVLSGDLQGARERTEEALKLLNDYLAKRPRDDDAVTRKAGLIGLQAGILRDSGKADEAMNSYNEAVQMLEAVHQRQPQHAQASYRLALVWWQKGRMLGMNGSRGEEITLMNKASDLFAQLQEKMDDAGPGPEQLQRSHAYLMGDIGHAHDIRKDRAKAKQALQQAAVLWRGLIKMRPRSEEYLQALGWCEQRLKEID